jgi:hypothetical protein
LNLEIAGRFRILPSTWSVEGSDLIIKVDSQQIKIQLLLTKNNTLPESQAQQAVHPEAAFCNDGQKLL